MIKNHTSQRYSVACSGELQRIMLKGRCICLRLLVICFLVVFYSCGFSRIVLLDDSLTAQEHLDLGLSYEKNNEFDPAIKQYEMAAKRLPVAYLYLGNIYFQKNNFEEAENNYKEAIRRDPNNADAYNNLAWLYYTKKENLDVAEELAQQAVKINPSKENSYIDTVNKIRMVKK